LHSKRTAVYDSISLQKKYANDLRTIATSADTRFSDSGFCLNH